MTVYYNEKDKFAAAWLRELIKEGLIPDGEVDTRSIIDVQPGDLRGFWQCHFFAGIGGWALAFRGAGIEAKKDYWSGSCPCQPLSGAGKGLGHADERHLWPTFYECRPSGIFGEQVASTLGREWLAGIRADLEAARYAIGAANLPACCIGAPHQRYRNFWMAYPDGGNAGDGTLQRNMQHGQQPKDGSASALLGNAEGEGFSVRTRLAGNDKAAGCPSAGERFEQAGTIPIRCSDGRWRRVPANKAGEPEPALFPLAYGISNRVGMLRGAGNAIVPQVGAQFILAAEEARIMAEVGDA